MTTRAEPVFCSFFHLFFFPAIFFSFIALQIRLKSNSTLYLFEPGSSKVGPHFEFFAGKIIATCSPDDDT